MSNARKSQATEHFTNFDEFAAHVGLVDTKSLRSMVPKNMRDLIKDYNGYGILHNKAALSEILAATELKPVTRKVEDSEDNSDETVEMFETGVGLSNEGFLFHNRGADATCAVPW
nr:hypothetical protein BdHM001_35950 [Bdellovibrio sp. HM001]